MPGARTALACSLVPGKSKTPRGTHFNQQKLLLVQSDGEIPTPRFQFFRVGGANDHLPGGLRDETVPRRIVPTPIRTHYCEPVREMLLRDLSYRFLIPLPPAGTPAVRRAKGERV